MVPCRCSCVLYLSLLVSSSTVRSQPVPFDPEGSTKQRQQREKHASTLSLWGAVAVAANISSWGVGLAGSVASTAYSTVYDLGFGGKCNQFCDEIRNDTCSALYRLCCSADSRLTPCNVVPVRYRCLSVRSGCSSCCQASSRCRHKGAACCC
jgi:hypothetical protein